MGGEGYKVGAGSRRSLGLTNLSPYLIQTDRASHHHHHPSVGHPGIFPSEKSNKKTGSHPVDVERSAHGVVMLRN
ncbi:hypothetical protein ZHAS_00018780 [Anopheles sinensis]|uniref:Uncharacterized protein n=1 Tax=Anopheles sinensis TaxID=74873 RepID=A0A084WKJ1_ANOSI|nr:hypothetical protein ZHAS_00018780 [Anopheles sinensis]